MRYNLTYRFNNILSNNIDKKILGYKKNNNWIWKTRKDLKVNILNCIDVLKDRKIQLNDRVMYKGNNSFEWISWNIATNSLGAVWVPLYTDQQKNMVDYIIKDCTPKLCITNEKYQNVDCISNKVLDNTFSNTYKNDIPIEEKSDISNLIYTSGTTGNPKGVILTHKNLLSNYEAIDKRFIELRDEDITTLNILPWAHIYGLTTELYYNILSNNRVALASSKEDFIKELREIKPDYLYLVPRILELIKKKLSLFDKKYIKFILPYALKYLFGGNVKAIFIGGALLDPDTKNFYLDNGIHLCEGYGCTETSPMISVNGLDKTFKPKSIGKIMDNLNIEIMSGEICVSGPSVMKGYWNDKQKTKDSFIEYHFDKFYKTGDEGEVKEGYLYFKGRISENYKLDNGKFVSVSNVESIIKQFIDIPFLIYGENKPYNIIIAEDIDYDSLNQSTIYKINEKLDNYLHVKKILFVKKDFFSEFLTPKMSLKRKSLIAALENEIKEIYKQ
jgi:long-chain acyl-CoA synthetase